MRKNVASQTIGCQLINKTDGSNVTSGTTTVYITIDGGTQSTGGSAVHEGNGGWSYAPSQAETNGNHILYTFVNTSAVSVSVNVYPVSYDPTSATNLGLTNLDATITSRMATYTQPTGFLAATFPATVASTTNITAATGIVLSGVTHTNAVIPTVTNLTNAPTSGDFTATMKTSIGTAVAASAVASVTAPVTVGTNNDKTGYSLTVTPPTSAQIATAIFTDLLAGSDFSTVASFGKLVKDNLDAAITSRMATYTQPTGFLAATFPTTVASTTNITAGTITTVTNVSNLSANAIGITSFATDSITAGSVSAAAVTKIQAGLSTYAGGDTSGTTTLLSRLSATRAGYLDNLSGGPVALASGVTVTTNNDKTGYSLTVTPPTSAQIATAIFTALLAGSDFATVASFGKLIKDNLDAAVTSRMATYTQPTGFLTATFPTTVASTTNITAGTITSISTDGISAAAVSAAAVTKIQTGLSTHTASDVWAVATRRLTDGTNIVLAKGTGVTGFNDLSAAQVNAEVVDVFTVDTFGEPTGVPATTTTLSNKLGHIYATLINKLTSTATTKTFYDYLGASKWTKATSDDSTTYAEQKGA